MIDEFLQGDQSRWRPYFDVLPEEFDTPMFWSNQELAELQASAISSKVGKDEADNMFRAKVLPTVQEHADVFYPRGAQRLGEDRLMALAHRMGSTIMAYAFDLENEEEDPEDGEDEWMEDKEGKLMMGMVPMADILNADAAFNVSLSNACFVTVLTTFQGARQSRGSQSDGHVNKAYTGRAGDPELLWTALKRRSS
jgi:SET domain-containing protein 6